MSVALSSTSAVEEKRRRLARLLEERAARPQSFPLSFTQQRVWFLDQLDPGSPAYQLSTALRLRGLLSPAAFEASLREIVRRHKVLRTRFTTQEGEPVQIVDRHIELTLPAVDLSGLPDGLRQGELRRLVQGNLRTPFDLRHGHLFRGTVVRLGEREHAVLLSTHHIVSDGWSNGVIVRELAALYPAFCAGRPSPLPRLPLQYAEYAVWQRQWLTGEVLEAQLAYWKERLSGTAPLELPVDHPRPAVQTFRGAVVPFSCPVALRDDLAALGRRQGATLFMTLLAAFQAELGRFSGQEDVSVGSPIANRGRRELELLIGFFANTLVLRADLSGNPPFRELLERVREVALGAFAHQDMPLEILVQELQPERDLARAPLFQVLFALQTATVPALELPGLALEPIEAESGTAKAELALDLVESPWGLQGSLEYNTDLFDRTTALRLVDGFLRLLQGAAASPETRVGELPVLSPAERSALLFEWNDTAADYFAPAAIHELLMEQAGRTPDRTAAVGPQGAMSYRDIAQRSAVLADTIHALLGGALDRPVALLADPEPQVLVGMIAILQAGGGFVPLDPRHPDERLAWTLGDAACEVLVTRRRYRDRAGRLGVRHVLCLEDALPSATEPAGDGPRRKGTERSLAYVVYTSGSTGRPKGVQISHENLTPMLLWGCDYFGLGEHTHVLQSLSFCFDFGIFEHLTTLLAGGTLVFPGEAAGDPRAFARQIVRHGIDTLHTTPAFARELAAAGVRLDGLDILHLGGEALSRDTVARLREAAPRATVYNGYGPTEATVNSSIFRIGGPEEVGWPVVPIGRRSADNALYILDGAGRLVPLGVRGELHVGGIGVARGYLNRPDLTADRFVPDPFGPSPGGRLYRTGDLVRHLPGGDIEFLGRADHQVKIRGFRIELGEVEAALVSLAGVREAVVLAREDRPGERRLVAYVVGDVAADALRSSLRERLPDSMVPSAFVTLAALPLTSNGKVDRKALPAPDWQSAGEAYLAPRTPVEEVLAGIWAELLGAERIGAADDFFALGGHSLLATRVVSRLREAFGVEMPLRELFEAPRLGDLAARIEAARSAGAGLAAPPLVPLARTPRAGDPPLSFSQERLWFLDQLEPGNPTYNIPGAIELTGHLDVAALAAALTGLAGRHEVLRTVFRLEDGEPRQHILPALEIRLPVLDLAGLPPAVRLAEAERLAAEHARKRFDLARGPLLDAALVRLDRPDSSEASEPSEPSDASERLERCRHRLLIVLHHVICDGWSIPILLREVGSLYEAFAADWPSPLAELTELPVQYADFAVWQRELVAGSRQNELAWWMDELGGGIAPLDLPTDRPRPAVQTYRGGRSARILPPSLAARLIAFGRARGATLFMVLLTAIQALLHRHSGQDDILVGAPVAGRRAVEVEGLIGCFLNTLVLRTDLGGRPGFRELAARVREVTLGAYSHQDVPFEAILTSLPQTRDLSRTPLFQVMVNLLNLPAAEMRLPGLRVAAAPPPAPHSKFDMTFYLSEGGEGVYVDLVYNADLFDAGRMEEVLSQLEAFLDQALERPDEPIGALSLVTAAARAVLPDPCAELSAAWEGAVHEIFARHAARAPHALAVADPTESWTYAELGERAGRLAARLRAGGVGPGDVVAFWAHRSAPLVWGVLGVLQAGAAFLVLDPRHPAPRQAQMVNIARPAAWLRVVAAGPVPAEIEDALDATGCALRLELPAKSEDPAFLASFPDPLPAVVVGPDDLAYVAFTSGSTGIPKGVLGRHGSLSHFVPWLCRRFDLSPADRYSLLSGLAHDPLHRDLFTPLQTGAAVLIPDPETMDEPGRLAAWMREAGVTIAHLTPALGQILTTGTADGLRVPTLRYAFLVGDILTRRDVARLRDLAPGVTCVNYYGSTETQRAVGYHVAEPGPSGDPARVKEVLPLGRGIPDVQLLVLSPAGQLAGIGELGEISVRSPHLAIGYLDDPQLTAERFLAAPSSGQVSGRLYRTGDLGRYLPNGEVELVGRADAQVKIRGFRIEPGEIESILRRLPGIRDAVVVARQDGGEPYLAAYVVPAPGADLDTRELRTHLRGHLPDAMVPAAFVAIDRMPLTPNRKVDRKALPAPERRSAEESWRAPRTPVEEILAGIWAELLGLEQVGAGDDFFALGGHSLLAVRLIARIESAFAVRLPISTLFEAPTVERLAAVLERGEIQRSRVVRLHPGGAGRPLFLLHPIGGDVFSYVELARRLGTDRPVYGLQAVLATGEDDLTMEELAAQYLATLRQVQPEGPWLLAGWSFGAVVAYEMAQQLESRGETVPILTMIDPPPPPDGRSEGVDDGSLLAGFASRGNLSERRKTFIREAMEGLDVDTGLDRLIELGRAEGSLPPDVDKPRLRERFDLYSRNVKALRGYVPRPYPGRVTLFRASGSLAPGAQDLTSGWGAFFDGRVHLLDADHESLLRSPALDRLVEELRSDLLEAEALREPRQLERAI